MNLSGTFGVTNALMFLVIMATDELTPQNDAPSHHLLEED